MAVDEIIVFRRSIKLPTIGGLRWRAWRLIQAVRLRRLLRLSGRTDEENLLYLIARREYGIRAVYLRPFGISPKLIRSVQNQRKKAATTYAGISVEQILQQARDDAKRFGHLEIGVEHMLLALAAFDTPDAEFLRQHNVTYNSLERYVSLGPSWSVGRLFLGKPTFYCVSASNAQNKTQESRDKPS